MNLTWLGHAGIQLFADNKTVYINPVIDPFQLIKYPKAHLILITNTDPHHYSIETCRRLLSDEGYIGGPPEAAALFHGMKTLKPQDSLEIPFCTLTVLDGYGYLLEIENKKVCYTDDSIPDKPLHPDILLLNTSRTREAVKRLPGMKPRLILPIHWGRIEGTKDDADQLIQALPFPYSEKVRIIKENTTIDIDELLRTV